MAHFGRERSVAFPRLSAFLSVTKLVGALFPEFRIHIDDGDTVLSGALADQASVYGVLAAMESLGLELLEMRRVMPA